MELQKLQELDDIETITDMIQQRASRLAKVITKPLKARISSPKRALMTKRRDILENGNGNDKQRIK